MSSRTSTKSVSHPSSQPQPKPAEVVSNIELDLQQKKILPAPMTMSKASLLAASEELRKCNKYAIWESGVLKPIAGITSRGHQQQKTQTTKSTTKPSSSIVDFVFVRDLRLLGNREVIRKGLVEKGFSDDEVSSFLENSFDNTNFKEGQRLHEAYMAERQADTKNRPVRARPRWSLTETETILKSIDEVKKEGKSVTTQKKAVPKTTTRSSKKTAAPRAKKETSLSDAFSELAEGKVLYVSMVNEKQTCQNRQYTTLPKESKCFKYSGEEGKERCIVFQKDYSDESIDSALEEMGLNRSDLEDLSRDDVVAMGSQYGQVVKPRPSKKSAEATTTTTTTTTTAPRKRSVKKTTQTTQ